MKARAIFLLRFILLATFGLPAKAIVAQTVITEDFNDNSRSWWTGHDLGRAIIAEVKNGSYFIVGGNQGFVTGQYFPELLGQENFTIEFSLQMLSGDPGQSYGVMYGDFLTGNNLDFGLNDGGVFIRQSINRNLSFLRGGAEPCPPRVGDPLGTPDCKINKFSANQPVPNRFTIVKNGTRYQFLLNDKLLTESTVLEPQINLVGIMVWAGLTIEVQKITIFLGAQQVNNSRGKLELLSEDLSYNADNIDAIRKKAKIVVAKVEVDNDLQHAVTAHFYAPERPTEIAYSMTIPAGKSMRLEDDYGLPMSIGDDWGISLTYPDGRKTAVSPVLLIYAKRSGGAFIVHASEMFAE